MLMSKTLISVILHLLVFAKSQQTVTVEAPLVDIYCWSNRNGIAWDTQKQLKDEPYSHTVHCLVEVSLCVNSGYIIVHKPPGSAQYVVQYTLDETLNQLAYDEMLLVPVGSARNQQTGYNFTATGIDDGNTDGVDGSTILKAIPTTDNPTTADHTAQPTTSPVTSAPTAVSPEVCTNGNLATVTANKLTISAILCADDDKIYINILYPDFVGDWFGIVFSENMLGEALIYTSGKHGVSSQRTVALYAYMNSARNLNTGVNYVAENDWTEEYKSESDGIHLIYSQLLANTDWDLNTESITFGYALGAISGGLEINFHSGGQSENPSPYILQFTQGGGDDCLVGDIVYSDGDSVGYLGITCNDDGNTYEGLQSICVNGEVIDSNYNGDCDMEYSGSKCCQSGVIGSNGGATCITGVCDVYDAGNSGNRYVNGIWSIGIVMMVISLEM